MRFCATIFVLLCAMRASADDSAVHIARSANDPTRVLVVCRLSREASEKLSPPPVSDEMGRKWLALTLIDDATGESGPPVFGRYEVSDGRLEFRPEFGLVHGIRYRATAFGPNGAVLGTAEYRVPEATTTKPTVVQAITPSGKRLPANVLRFYITFSRPMREGREVLERIKLYDDAGNEIVSPWRDLELWNADATRLSLFLHPGRIKQGVNLREQLGPILLPNRKYAIVFSGDLRDSAGGELGRDFRHEFATSAELRTRINVAAWKITTPAAETREPLRIEFDRALDAALAMRLVRIYDVAGKAVPGESRLENDERVRVFTPSPAWQAERYRIEVDPTLEDQAGNTPIRVFDTDLAEPMVEILPPQLRREFTPR